jgi:short-subunit dehydrogenase
VLPLLLYVLFKICRTLFVEAPLTDLSISMKGKTIFITGSSDGIGRLSALHLAKMGADIIFACRNETKTRKVMKEISKEAPNSKVISI